MLTIVFHYIQKVRIWEQAEADELKYVGELQAGDAGNRGQVSAYPKLLAPIVQMNNEKIPGYAVITNKRLILYRVKGTRGFMLKTMRDNMLGKLRSPHRNKRTPIARKLLKYRKITGLPTEKEALNNYYNNNLLYIPIYLILSYIVKSTRSVFDQPYGATYNRAPKQRKPDRQWNTNSPSM